MTCSERLQAELQDDPGGGPPLIPVDPPDPPSSPREQELTGETKDCVVQGSAKCPTIFKPNDHIGIKRV